MSSRHFIVLDGLRGVAAICVMTMHISLWFGSVRVLGGSHLAVDFFFCLSGFVIAYAYQEKLFSIMSFKDFMVARMIRLYPLIFLGFTAGAAFSLLRLFDASGNHAYQYGFIDILKSVYPSLLLIPNIDPSLGYNLFPLDGATWSLFYEIFANVVYCLLVMTLGTVRRVLIASCIIFLASLWFAATGHDISGGFKPSSFLAGFPRVGLSFFLGAILFNIWSWKRHVFDKIVFGHFVLLSAILVGCFMAPWNNPLWSVLCLAIVFPAIVLMGATQETAVMSRICKFLGAISYPLYILHEPVIMMFVGAFKRFKPFAGSQDPVLLALSGVAAIAVSYIALKIYDEPVRRYLGVVRRNR